MNKVQPKDEAVAVQDGKCADFVIADKNPMKTDAYKIRDIEVNETWVNGQQVFKKN